MIISGSELLARVRQAFPDAEIRQAFPFLRVRLVSEEFIGDNDDKDEGTLAKALELDVIELRKNADRLFLRFELFARTSEVVGPARRGETWLGAIAEPARALDPAPGIPPVVHFYGFKGGQGRSTALGFLSNALAADGYRVLMVDVDAEAPSLDVLTGAAAIPPEASIVGLRAGLDLVPMPISSPRGGGSISIVGFRPASEHYDIDAAALAFEAAVSTPSHEALASAFRTYLAAAPHDVVFLDHRTGLGPSVPTWVRALPGPVIVFDRLDGQSVRAVRDVKHLWSGLASPGILVSHVPQPITSLERPREHLRSAAWHWLEALAQAQSARAEEPIEPGDLEDHWVLWPEDNAFRSAKFPEVHEVGGPTRDAASRIRELLGLLRSIPHEQEPLRTLHPSGASDQGLFLVTEALRELRQPASPIRYILGRKGTGKTRLLHELAQIGLGEPLVVANDETAGGLPAIDVHLKSLLGRVEREGNPEALWWTLLGAGFGNQAATRGDLQKAVDQTPLLSGLDVRRMTKSGKPRVFLIDGLESIWQRKQAHVYIQALLNVAAALENDDVFRSKITLRIFLRTDIAQWGFENFEQQSAGRTLSLSWRTQSILNFVLSRLVDLPWFSSTFPSTIREISKSQAAIQQCAVSTEECMDFLLQIFPQKLGRKNINTTTFLKTYFSDDPAGEQSYYPRVYDTFLAHIDRARKPLVGQRVGQDIIMAAHDEASAEFLTQVRQELLYLTPLEYDQLDRFIRALHAQETPFNRRELANRLRNSLKFPKPKIDRTFEAMREIGIFEVHPTRPAAWRVGRLFKAALKMKYARGEN